MNDNIFESYGRVMFDICKLEQRLQELYLIKESLEHEITKNNVNDVDGDTDTEIDPNSIEN